MASLAVLAEQTLDRLGDHVSLVFEGRSYRMAELHERSTRLATGLRAIGIAPGDRVVLQMTNRPEVSVTAFALWRAGAVTTPVMPTLTVGELRHVLTDSGAVAVVVSDDLLAKAYEATAGLDVRVVVAGEPGATDALRLAELEAADPLPLQPRDELDVAALLYTGGTTGRSKGVALTHRGLWRTTQARAQVVATAQAPRLIIPLPLSHVFGLTSTLTRLHLPEGAPMWLMRRFEARPWLDLVAEHGIQSASAVPSMLQLLLREDLDAYDLSTLTYITAGGAPLSEAVRLAFQARVPSVLVCDGYGCTEATSVVSMNPPTAFRPGTSGRAIPGATLGIFDDGMRPVETGQDGEICVQSPGVMAGYWRDPGATSVTVVDGWLRTGDIGHLDEDGYVTVVDRKKDLIIRGGFNVYPSDVEDVLLAHPAVSAAAAVGRPDDTYGEEVVAFVALHPGADEREPALLAWAAARLAAHKRPRELHVVETVPLTSVGKTDRKTLRAGLVAERSRVG